MPAIRIYNPNTGDRAVYVYIDLVSIVPTNEKGDNKYIFKISTKAKAMDEDGEYQSIDPIYLYETNVNGFLKALPKAVAAICSQIYWGESRSDEKSPYVEYYGPVGYNVSLFSSVIVGITDPFPSNGINADSITMSVNGFDVTDDIILDGTFNEVVVSWSPKKRVTNV